MSKKDKLLESAQKFIAKGQFDRAVKEYEQLLAMEPGNLGIRQRIADLLLRDNRREQAVEEYLAVAKGYAGNAHYLKAIAVYKQVQKLDPANPAISVSLGSLNEKQGLIGNAMAEYASALSMFEKAGDYASALNVLETMRAIDPQNPQILLKCSEALFKSGKREEAYESFSQLGLTLRRKNDATGLKSVLERVRTLFPDRPDLLLNIARLQSQNGDAAEGAATLRQFLAAAPANRDAWLLLLDILNRTGERPAYLQACRECIAALPSDPAPRERLIRTALDAGAWGSACAQLTEHGPTLRDAGASDTLAELAGALFAAMPADPELLAGFAGAASACGLIDLAERAEQRATQLQGTTAAEEPLGEVPAPTAATEPEPAPLETEAEWEEELDLTPLADEDAAVAGPQAEETAGWLESPGGEEETGVEVQFELGELPETPWEQEPSASVETGAGESFTADLAGELTAELEGMPFDLGEEAEEEQVSVIRRGVNEQLGQDDAESHYSLGIAFKEMGLYDEAIAEFRVASRAPERKVDSLVLQGLCYRDKGDTDKAMSLLRSGMGLQGLSRDEQLTLKYELALLNELGGNHDAAAALYREIAAVNRHFRETAQKLAALGEAGEKEGYVTLSLDDLDD